MHNCLHWIRAAAAMLLLVILPIAQTQETSDGVSMTVDAGYGSYFREGHWLPLRVTIRNEGDALSGRLVVRPETSGPIVTSAYSTPVDLPAGSQKEATLYVTARRRSSDLTLELLNASGERVTQQDATLRALSPTDRINVIVTGPGVSAPSLSEAHAAGAQAVQAVWTVADIPDHAQALAAVDLLLVAGADTDALSLQQRDAIRGWLTGGGHLIVSGGSSWRLSTAGFADLLPLTVAASQTRSDLDAIAHAVGDWTGSLPNEPAVLASGTSTSNAQIIAQTADGLPLIARRIVGAGTVDYLAFDPTDEPLRSWDGLPDLWFRLAASTAPQPPWSSAPVDAQQAGTALSMLPGVDLLPPVMAMVTFLVTYIVLIGPVTYWLLSRLNRLEWAWFTIPVLILIFSLVAWQLGFNLRGQQVIVSRLTLVESWPDSDEAHVRQMIGLLPPRRGVYELASPEGFLRAMPGSPQWGGATQSGVEIRQMNGFGVQEMTIDGGLFANFSQETSVPAPAISGTLTLTRRSDPATSMLQGALRNDTASLLRDPVVLARGVAFPLGGDLAPGELRVLRPGDLVLDGSDRPSPASLVARHGRPVSQAGLSFGFTSVDWSVIDVLSGQFELNFDDYPPDHLAQQTVFRQHAFLSSLSPGASGDLTGWGSRIFLAAWAADWPRDLIVAPGDWMPLDTVLYLVELDVTAELPTQSVIIAADEFSWVVTDLQGSAEGDPIGGIILYPESAMSLRYMPAPDAQLSQVDALYIERAGDMVRGLRVELWNWRLGQWDVIEMPPGDEWLVAAPAPYVGPGNMMDLRLSVRDAVSTVNLNRFAITQQGLF